jgi:hypothetical protein
MENSNGKKLLIGGLLIALVVAGVITLRHVNDDPVSTKASNSTVSNNSSSDNKSGKRMDEQKSNDSKKIAWTEKVKEEEYKDHWDVTWFLNVADIDGKNKKQVLMKLTGSGEEELMIAKWGKNNQDIYYGVHINALDSFEYLENLYKINASTGKSELIFGKPQVDCENINNIPGVLAAISNNDESLAYYGDKNLCVRNIKTGKTITFSLPKDMYEYRDAVFSPDDKMVAFVYYIDNNDKDEETYEQRFVIADLNTQAVKVWKTVELNAKDGPPRVNNRKQIKWTSNNAIELVDMFD